MKERNQCDGCQAKLPTRVSKFGGAPLHVDLKTGHTVMVCQKHKYQGEGK